MFIKLINNKYPFLLNKTSFYLNSIRYFSKSNQQSDINSNEKQGDHQQQQQEQDHQQQRQQAGESMSKSSIYSLDVAQEYIKNNIRKFDWTTYAAANYLPSPIRSDYYTMHWFYQELNRVVENTRESALGIGKLDFWTDSIEKIYIDKPIKEPVSICLHRACKNNPIPKGLLLRLVNAKKYEINTPEIGSLSQFETIAENNRTTLLFLDLKLMRIESDNNPNFILAIEHVGKCLGMLDYIKRIPYGLRKYKLYLPEDILRKHTVSVRTLWNRVEGKPKEELFDVILELAAHAKMHLEKAIEYQKDLPPNAFRAFLPCVEAQYYLDQLEKYNFDVFHKALNTPAYVVVPYRMFKAARNKTFVI